MSDTGRLVDMIAGLVRGGLSPRDASRHLSEFVPHDQVRAALLEFELKTGRIRTMKEPPGLIDQRHIPGGPKGWYTGPSENDRFWPALKHLLEQKGWPGETIESVDRASTRVVSLLPPPGAGRFNTRGLVLGYVQSGKTANYTSVIAKAADVGYRFFLILSGVHNALRRQTQLRLQRELVDLNPEDWVSLTYDDQDFRTQAGLNADAFLTDHHQQRIIGVVKKNATVLRRLRDWLRSAKESVRGSCPVLLIDDEADQASLNVSGSTDRRTAINRLILEILGALPKVAYVGYTATPFANVLTDPAIPDDLYPRDFILDLPRPAGYFGPERIFGRERLTTDEPEENFDGLDMIRIVPQEDIRQLQPEKQSDVPGFRPTLARSLEDAVRYFWLATAARAARGEGASHSSMLIHTTLYVDVHERFRTLIEGHRDKTLDRLTGGDSTLLAELRSQWVEEQRRVPSETVGEVPTGFDELSPHLARVVRETKVVIENSRSLDRLVYGEDGRIQIVIGGNTLSRGLTLEGLVVSLFVRTASAYDTLLQMGRWFGFRPRYSDLPRIWMSGELRDWFFDLATVEQEIRNDIARYERDGLTPLEFGVRIRVHPHLAITSRLKMTTAITCNMSYEGKRVQTIYVNHRDRQWLIDNLNATKSLLDRALRAGIRPDASHGDRVLLAGVPVEDVLRFIDEYRFHERSDVLRPDLLRGYIEAQNREGELLRWNVVIVSRHRADGDRVIDLAPGIQVPLLTRSRAVRSFEDPADLKAIMSNVDLVADLLDVRRDDAARRTPDQLIQLRTQRLPSTGLLLLYPVDKDSRPTSRAGSGRGGQRAPLEAVEDFVGVALVFPKAKNLTPQEYKTADLSRVPREVEEELPDEEA